MLPDAVRRLVNGFSIKPGERAVVLTVDDRGLAAAADLEAAGVQIAEVVDFRTAPTPPAIEAQGKGGKVAPGRDQRPPRQGRPRRHVGQPAAELQAARAGRRARRVRRRPRRLRPARPAARTSRRSAPSRATIGEPAVPSPVLDHRGDKCFVCFCEDQTVKDLKYAIDEGFDSIELSKRYTTVTMGPCQGRLCHTNSIRVYAKTTGIDENTIGTTTVAAAVRARLDGAARRPARRSRASAPPLHHRHKDMGGKMMWTGAWRRPHSYGDDPGAEAQHVHRGARADRRLDARQDPRDRARGRRLPRPRLPEPLLRPQGRAHPLRRAHRRRGPDHGRRRRRAARRRDVLRLGHLDRRRRRLPVVHVVERGLVHGRRSSRT